MTFSSTGRIKSFSIKNGYGFISDGGENSEDVFFGKEHLPAEWQLGGQEIMGRDVVYEMSTSPEGKAQARNIRAAGPPPTGSRTVGLVKSWNSGKGFGFLRVHGLDGDIFFARDRLPSDCRDINRMDGLSFSFELSETPDGKFQAHHMQNVGSQPQIQQPSNPMRNGISGLKRPMHNGEMGSAKRHFNRPDSGGRFVGSVKSYNAKNGYGFIVSNQVAEDVVIYSKDLNSNVTELHQHDDVEFSIRYGASGRPQACELVLLEAGAVPNPGTTREYAALTVDDLKLYTAQLNTKDLGDLAAYTTQMLQSKLGYSM